jgi:hypothetical protein
MIEFDKKKIMQEKTVVRFATYEQATELVKWTERNGIHWNDVRKKNGWDNYKDKLCYNLFGNGFSDLEFYLRKNFTILAYDDVILKLREKKVGDDVVYMYDYKLNPGVVRSVDETGDNQYEIKSKNGELANMDKEYVWFNSPGIEFKITENGIEVTGEEEPVKYSCPICNKDIKSTINECDILGAHICLHDTAIDVGGNSVKDVYDNLCKFYEAIKIEKIVNE